MWHSVESLTGMFCAHVFAVFPVCRYRQLKEKHELKSHEASLMASRVEQSTLHQQLSQLKALQESVGG